MACPEKWMDDGDEVRNVSVAFGPYGDTHDDDSASGEGASACGAKADEETAAR